MSCWAVDAAEKSCVCSKMKRTATRANSKTREMALLADGALEADAVVADAADAVVVVGTAAVCMAAPATSVTEAEFAPPAVLDGTLNIGGT